MKDEFLALYEKDFDIMGGTKLETFLGMVVEQSDKSIKIYLDNYVEDVVAEYAEYIKQALRPQSLPVSHSRLKMSLSSPISLNRSTIARS